MTPYMRKLFVILLCTCALTAMADRVIHIKNGTVSGFELNPDPLPIEGIEW